jgi:hypothetical protein
MRNRLIWALAATASALAGCGGSVATPRAVPATTGDEPSRARSRTVAEDCSTRSEASFPGAFADARNVVVGPLVLVGAAYTPASVVTEFGGNKFPLLVVAGHRVRIELSRRTRRVAGLAYGPLPQGEVHLSDAHRAVMFVACRRGEPSGSAASGRPVTFWSGFVLTRSPRCVPIDVWVDDERAARSVALRMGVRDCARN